MDDFVPKPGSVKVGGLGPKAQKLKALREKAAAQQNGGAAKQHGNSSGPSFKANALGHRKPSFNRKSV